VLGLQLDSMILKVFSNLNGSMILLTLNSCYRFSKDSGFHFINPVSSGEDMLAVFLKPSGFAGTGAHFLSICPVNHRNCEP